MWCNSHYTPKLYIQLKYSRVFWYAMWCNSHYTPTSTFIVNSVGRRRKQKSSATNKQTWRDRGPQSHCYEQRTRSDSPTSHRCPMPASIPRQTLVRVTRRSDDARHGGSAGAANYTGAACLFLTWAAPQMSHDKRTLWALFSPSLAPPRVVTRRADAAWSDAGWQAPEQRLGSTAASRAVRRGLRRWVGAREGKGRKIIKLNSWHHELWKTH